MPHTPMKWAQEFARKHQEREFELIGRSNRIEGQIGDLLLDLDGLIEAMLKRVADRIFRNNRINMSLWESQKNLIINSLIQTPFNTFAREGEKIVKAKQKQAWNENRTDLVKLFKSLYPLPTRVAPLKDFQQAIDELKFQDSEAEVKFLKTGLEVVTEENVSLPLMEIQRFGRTAKKPVHLIIGAGPGGTRRPGADFEMFLARQLQVGLNPADLIRTFNTEHIAQMQKVLLNGIRRGQSLRHTASQFVKQISTEMTTGAERKKLMFNTMRIFRTSHQRAAASSVSLYSLVNRDLISGLRRVADGRPCLACISLDGQIFPVGSTIADHPQGMCVFVPVFKNLNQLGFDVNKIPKKHRAAFDNTAGNMRTMLSRFMAMSEEEQRRIFANESLYNLWKSENLPLHALVRKVNDMFVPKTFKDVNANIQKLGGRSFPKAGVSQLSNRFKKSLIVNVDPVDRATAGLVLVRYEDVPKAVQTEGKLKGRLGGNGLGFGSDITNQQAIDKADGFTNWSKNPPWWDFNERYRALGVYLRVAQNGKFYYAMPVAKHKRLLQLIKGRSQRKRG